MKITELSVSTFWQDRKLCADTGNTDNGKQKLFPPPSAERTKLEFHYQTLSKLRQGIETGLAI